MSDDLSAIEVTELIDWLILLNMWYLFILENIHDIYLIRSKASLMDVDMKLTFLLYLKPNYAGLLYSLLCMFWSMQNHYIHDCIYDQTEIITVVFSECLTFIRLTFTFVCTFVQYIKNFTFLYKYVVCTLINVSVLVGHIICIIIVGIDLYVVYSCIHHCVFIMIRIAAKLDTRISGGDIEEISRWLCDLVNNNYLFRHAGLFASYGQNNTMLTTEKTTSQL